MANNPAAQTSGLPLFGAPVRDPAPVPPSGPAVLVPTHKANTMLAYRSWRLTREGQWAFAELERLALTEWHSGAMRIAVKGLVERVRSSLRFQINNTYAPWIADELVESHPELTDVIERRRRRNHG